MGKTSTVIDCLKKLLIAILVAFVISIIGFIAIKWLGDDAFVEDMSEVFVEDYAGVGLDLSYLP